MRHWRGVVVGMLAAVLSGALAGCGPQFQTTYNYTTPQSAEGRLCANQCQTTQTYCRNNCGLEEKNCRQAQKIDAQRQYERYVKEQEAKQKKIERSPSSFESYYMCGDDKCASVCAEDYRTCYSTCGGQVQAVTRCVSGCDELPPSARTQYAPEQNAPPAQYVPPPQAIPGPQAGPGRQSGPAAAGASPLCRQGAKVDVLWQGQWYAARVKAPPLSDGRCPIHYIGYADSDDEAVSPKALRASAN